jgi:hypothetical protein
MKQVSDKAFAKYGRVLELDCQEISTVMEKYTPLPNDVVYTPSEPQLEKLPAFKALEEEIYGGMPIQFGYCNGDNHLLNAVEYHRSSEVDIAITDLILILGWQPDIDLKDYSYDTGKMEMFFVPAGTTVELYATTLHYAPCSAAGKFRCGIVLPKGTNEEIKTAIKKNGENKLLFAVNKWLIAHKDSGLETVGAFIGLTGENLKA